jgi:WhiB family transcriptional regulator, redox-sensing transcriptional regulator
VTLTADSLSSIEPIRNWRDLASCRDTAPDLFFPVGATGLAVGQIARAKAVCDMCPAKEPCLQYAIEHNQDSGVWGGTSEEERRVLRRAWVKNRKAVSA